jgi:predicted RNA-binding Zn-ribbon protein involved in translation (DUF1610 family)
MLQRARAWPRRPLDFLVLHRPNYLPPFIWRRIIPLIIIGRIWSLGTVVYAIGLLLAITGVLDGFTWLSPLFDGKFVLLYICLVPTTAIPVLAVRARILEILLWISEREYLICGCCGYDLRGSSGVNQVCPECGRHYSWNETRRRFTAVQR